MIWSNETALLECCDVSTGKYDANHGVDDGLYTFFTCAGKPIRANTYSFEGDSIILPGNGANVGLVLFYSGKFEAYQRTYVLNNFKPDVYSKYVFYHLKALWKRRNENSQFGSATNYIRMQNFEKYSIPLPPLETQKQIAAVLEKADQLRKDCQQMEQELNSLAQSVFIEMFGDPVTNPKGWRVRDLQSLIVKGDRINYGVVQPGEFETVDTGVPLIRISDFSKGKISLHRIKFISADVDAKYKRSKIIGDEVLIACVGATIGKTAVVTEQHKGYNIARAVTRVRVDGTINRYFLQKYLESDFVQSFFIQETRSVGQPTLNTSLIAKTPVLIPDEKTQNLFLKFSERNDKQIINSISLAQEYELQFNALMQKAFSGELNLNITKTQ